MLCVRGWNIHELLGTRERITFPMVRKNGRLEIVSYMEAVDAAAAFLLESSKQGIDNIVFSASPRSSNEENYLLMKLARAASGSNNISIASESGHEAAIAILHENTGFPGMTGCYNDIEESDLLLVVSFDITRQNPILASKIT